MIKRTLRLSESLRSPRPRRWLSHLSISPTLDRWFPQTAARRSTRRSKCTRRRRGRCTSTRGVDFGATKARIARGKFCRRCSRRFSSSSSFLFRTRSRPSILGGSRREPSVGKEPLSPAREGSASINIPLFVTSCALEFPVLFRQLIFFLQCC